LRGRSFIQVFLGRTPGSPSTNSTPPSLNIRWTPEHSAKITEQYCKKGGKVYIEGALQTRKWTDQSGAETTEIVLRRR
jgi:hypothetical protein